LDLPREWLSKPPSAQNHVCHLGVDLASRWFCHQTDAGRHKPTKVLRNNSIWGKKSGICLKGSDVAVDWQSKTNTPDLEHGEAIRAQGACMRKLHSSAERERPWFWRMVPVQNKRREFLWVHPSVCDEY
jgi:hypothetical protein